MWYAEMARNRVLLAAAVTVLTALGAGCSTNVNRKAFASCQPRNIGIVLGYDLIQLEKIPAAPT